MTSPRWRSTTHLVLPDGNVRPLQNFAARPVFRRARIFAFVADIQICDVFQLSAIRPHRSSTPHPGNQRLSTKHCNEDSHSRCHNRCPPAARRRRHVLLTNQVRRWSRLKLRVGDIFATKCHCRPACFKTARSARYCMHRFAAVREGGRGGTPGLKVSRATRNTGSHCSRGCHPAKPDVTSCSHGGVLQDLVSHAAGMHMHTLGKFGAAGPWSVWLPCCMLHAACCMLHAALLHAALISASTG